MFKEIKNRDAWSTIRGFVYQVDTTILRWLGLQEDQSLELEKGEDIDIIKDGLGNAEASRILEQVKHRDSKMSLNTETTLELLFNFFVHKQNNPEQKLIYRFVSNAGYTMERPALFPKSKKGIAVWQEIFSEDNVSVTDKRLQVIKEHFVEKIKEKITDPNKTDDKVKLVQQQWSDFKTFVEDPKTLLQFIKDFEWSLESPESDKISEVVKQKIAESKHLPDGMDAELVYPRLFMFVFKLLTKSSVKNLDIATLKLQSSLPALDAEDESIFKIVSELLGSLQDRVFKIENTVAVTIEQIKGLAEEVSDVKSSDAVFAVRLKNITSTKPTVLLNGSSRQTKTKQLLDSLNQTPWINLQGINGTGKTQMALLTCESIENVSWIELREYNNSPEKSALYIEAILAFISGIPVGNDRNKWLLSVLAKLPLNAIIVINDLPQIDNTSPHKNLLIPLATNLSSQKPRLLTTSNYKIPSSIISTLPVNIFQEFDDFTFDDDEVKELLIKNGAPEPVLEFADLFASISHRNPQILSTIVNRLVAINWGKNSTEVFGELFKKEFSLEIFKDAQSSITKFITDAHTKDLLYRLSLIHWGYSFDIVRAVCEVEKKIDSPFEKLQGITNTWIEESGSIYKTSPLIHDLGTQNLPTETLKYTYGAIGHAILKQKEVDLINASRIITSFVKAENYNEAGIVLLTLLRSAKNEEAAKSLYDWGYLSYWTETELPINMSKSIKAHITVDQIRLRKLLNKDITILQNRLDVIVTEITDVREKIITLIVILANDSASNLNQNLEYSKFILENSAQLPDLFKDSFDQLMEGFLMMFLQKLETEDEVTTWLHLAEIYETATGISFYKNEIAETGITVLAEHIVKFENGLTNFEPAQLSARLDTLIEYFNKKELEIFAANILKERIALQFMVLNEPDIAEQMTVEWSEKFTMPQAKYLLCENLGKLYFNSKKGPKSTLWLTKAIEFDCEKQVTFADTLAYGAAAISDSDSGKALDYMKNAVRLTVNTPWASQLDIVQMLCELALSFWKNSEFKNSYDTFNDALIRLQETKNEKFGPYWIRLLSWMTHVLGYISADVSKDKLPQHFRDGSDYTKPYQGIFLFNTKDLSDLYTPNKDVLMLVQMAIFSEGVGNIEGAYKWSLRAFDEARSIDDVNLLMMVLIACNQYPLLNFKFEEHFEMAMQFHAISSHLEGHGEEKYAQISKINYEEIQQSKPSEKWNYAEDTIFTMSIIPMFLMVLIKFNQADNGDKNAQDLLQLIKNYSEKASDKHMWMDAYDIMVKIFGMTATVTDLTNEANGYGEQDNRNFQILCILGCIFLEKNRKNSIVQIVNVFPYLTKTFNNMPAIFRNILVPFVKYYVIKGIEENFVGNKSEFEGFISQVEMDSTAKSDPIQKILKPAIEVSDIVIQGDRKEWLTDYKEI